MQWALVLRWLLRSRHTQTLHVFASWTLLQHLETQSSVTSENYFKAKTRGARTQHSALLFALIPSRTRQPLRIQSWGLKQKVCIKYTQLSKPSIVPCACNLSTQKFEAWVQGHPGLHIKNLSKQNHHSYFLEEGKNHSETMEQHVVRREHTYTHLLYSLRKSAISWKTKQETFWNL